MLATFPSSSCSSIFQLNLIIESGKDINYLSYEDVVAKIVMIGNG